MKFVPPEPEPEPMPSFRHVLGRGLFGGILGCLVGLAGWFFSDDLVWFYSVPVGALLIFRWRSKSKPPVVW